MNVGICKIKIRLPENHSLKGKRGVVKSLVARLKNRYNLSVAEVDDNDMWQIATIGMCLISNNQALTNETLSKAVNFIATSEFDIEVLDYEIEIIAA